MKAMHDTVADVPRTVAAVGERAIVRRITARLTQPPWLLVGPGDDAAVLSPVPRALEVLTTDALVEGVHVDRRFCPPEAIGHKALAVNLSDLAAMGATPRAALLSLVVPGSLAIADLDGILDGLLALAARHQVTIAGGNVTRAAPAGDGPLVIDVTAVGWVAPRRVLTRSGARPGDAVYVTGAVGSGVVGLRALEARAAGVVAPQVPGAELRYLRPDPRVRAGMLLGRNKVATACMDLSDGLADAVRQVAAASGIGVIIDADAVPIDPEVRAWHRARGTD
ncbi:MAG: thiamine-phosphate kinase, partial [Acidimicrobiia bacterium]|nr:thiamine-phosphate kinase [Acidimicrobiia bacterium]